MAAAAEKYGMVVSSGGESDSESSDDDDPKIEGSEPAKSRQGTHHTLRWNSTGQKYSQFELKCASSICMVVFFVAGRFRAGSLLELDLQA